MLHQKCLQYFSPMMLHICFLSWVGRASVFRGVEGRRMNIWVLGKTCSCRSSCLLGLMSIWHVVDKSSTWVTFTLRGCRVGDCVCASVCVCVTPSDPDPLSISPEQVARWGCYEARPKSLGFSIHKPIHTHDHTSTQTAPFEGRRVNASK